ncbi:hypothetical protein D0Z07_6964 [Hyphodiscus hymeniophilus]|uniref:Uncharacterized protein n=1 Tax=Hyphodiscus hymeniophilus TaxID=353542 RepID=A0A9P6VG60_9HELO|nr:hypothetical protein D0Z07_6964 [Hyphodiscus hymeniophilus]
MPEVLASFPVSAVKSTHPISSHNLMWFRTGAFQGPPAPEGVRNIPESTPVVFPSCAPQVEEDPSTSASSLRPHIPLVALLQTFQRPADIQVSHFEALGLHVISDASPQDILPDASYLLPLDQWMSIPPEDLQAATIASKKPLNNGNLSPGLQTYLERRNELSIDNTAAFRTIRRIQPPTGETPVRLGNAYEFFKNLELLSGFWDDTSLPPKPESDSVPSSEKEAREELPAPHLRTHHRTGTGTQLPAEYRQHLITAFIKLVAYDFGCNVSFPRVEPRLHLTPPQPTTFPPSYFNSSAQFIYRTPRDRSSARMGVVEGPLAAVSCRTTTVFASEVDSKLDLAREVVAVLLTAQQRAREGKEEKRFGENKWWTTVPRWGGGPGGAIGKETDKTPMSEDSLSSKIIDPALAAASAAANNAATIAGQVMNVPERIADVKRAIGGINSPSPSPSKKSKRGTKNGNLAIYENYRRMLQPSSNWDPKARYEAIGKVKGSGFDDIFLVSALNHHVSLVRVHVPERLLAVLGGEVRDEGREWGKVVVYKSKWFDLFLKEERIDAMGLVWAMMSWLMRAVDEPAADESNVSRAKVEAGDNMDTT